MDLSPLKHQGCNTPLKVQVILTPKIFAQMKNELKFKNNCPILGLLQEYPRGTLGIGSSSM
jgi:hypothetical protein